MPFLPATAFKHYNKKGYLLNYSNFFYAEE